MNWWGKLIGGALGFALGGPLGALLGAALGHSFDKGIKNIESDMFIPGGANQERIQASFFAATFSIMGHLAKADGVVSKTEIEVARQTMEKMQLSDEQKQAAMNLFNQGKAADFDYLAAIDQLKKECGRRTNLLRMFMEIQLTTALADNDLHANEQSLLLEIAKHLGFQRRQFEQILAMMTAQQRYAHFGHSQTSEKSEKQAVNEAYNVLGMKDDCNDAELKKAYRKLISQHHPDKLVSKGLPEEMMKIATEKTREIKDAYERIKKYRAQTN
jgi:DnaJ like chaperone protein